MKTPVTYTAAVNNGTVSVSFSRKPRLLVRENIRAAGLRWKAESRAWMGKPEDPAALLAMLRDTLGAPAAVALDLSGTDLTNAEPETGEAHVATETAPEEIPAAPTDDTPIPDDCEALTVNGTLVAITHTEDLTAPAADPEPETPARAPTLEEAEETHARYTAALEQARADADAAGSAASKVWRNLLLDEAGNLRRRGELTDEEKAAAEVEEAPFKEQEEAAEKEVERLRLCVAYAADNLSCAREDYYLPIAAEILNRYAGKPAGEKTAAEISAKLTAALGCEARFYRRDNGYNEHHYGAGLTLRFGEYERISFWPDCVDGKTGKIKPYTPASHTAEYVTDIDAAVENLQTLEKQARGQMETVRNLCGRYNALLPSSRRSDNLYPRFS